MFFKKSLIFIIKMDNGRAMASKVVNLTEVLRGNLMLLMIAQVNLGVGAQVQKERWVRAWVLVPGVIQARAPVLAIDKVWAGVQVWVEARYMRLRGVSAGVLVEAEAALVLLKVAAEVHKRIIVEALAGALIELNLEDILMAVLWGPVPVEA